MNEFVDEFDKGHVILIDEVDEGIWNHNSENGNFIEKEGSQSAIVWDLGTNINW